MLAAEMLTFGLAGFWPVYLKLPYLLWERAGCDEGVRQAAPPTVAAVVGRSVLGMSVFELEWGRCPGPAELTGAMVHSSPAMKGIGPE